MADWSKPTTTSVYSNFVTELDGRLDELATQFNGASPTNLPTNTVRWNDTSKKWEKWGGSAWGDLATTYGVTSTASIQLATARTIALSGDVSGNVSFNGTANVTISSTLATSGVTAATYGSASQVPQIAVDAKGRITSATHLALGTMANQNSSSVSITGGTIGGVTLTPTTLTLPTGTGSTTEAVIQWHSTNDQLLIGRGASIGTISPDDKSTTLTNKTLGSGCSFSVDLATNGTITTSATTGNIFNTTVTTLNIGGAATGINLGANSATAWVSIAGTTDSTAVNNGALVVAGGLGIAKSITFGGTLKSYSSLTNQTNVDFNFTHNATNAQIYNINLTPTFVGGASTTVIVNNRNVVTIQPSNTTPGALTAYSKYNNIIFNKATIGASAIHGDWQRIDLGSACIGGTIDNVYGFMVGNPSIDAAATTTITNFRGFYVANYTPGSSQTNPTLVAAFNTVMGNNTYKWSLYASGGAKSYHEGNFLIGTTTDSGYKLRVEGTSYLNGEVSTSTITPIATTGNLMNTVATTLNIGGAATAVNIGSTGATIHTLKGTGAITLPTGTTAQRPTGVTGMIRYNSTDSIFEGYNGAWAAIGGGGFNRVLVTATGSSNYVKPAGLKYIKVIVIGAGGGASSIVGNANDSGAWSGASGATAIKWITASSLAATETCVVGAGGTGGAALSSYQSGGNGGNSSFGTHCTATGGGGGTTTLAWDPVTAVPTISEAIGPLPGTATGGDINIDGEYAEKCQTYVYTDGSTQFKNFFTRGANSLLGQGGARRTSVGNGNNGTGYGSGGSVGYETGTTDRAGGAGANGVIIIEEFY